MGLFSGKTRYAAYAGSAPMFEVDDRPATVKSQILQTSISGNDTMSGAIMMGIQTDYFARAKAMMRYASKADGYIRGFPTSNLNLITIAPDAIEAALTRAIGAYDAITWSQAGIFDEEFLLSKAIQAVFTDDDYFDWTSNGGLPADTHWDDVLVTTKIPVVNPDTSDHYDASNDFGYIRFIIDLDDPGLDLLGEFGPDAFALMGLDDRIDGIYTVTFDYTDNLGAAQVFTVGTKIDISEYLTGSHVMVRYELDGKTYYWTYLIGSGVDPAFELDIQLDAREGEYLPVAVLMHDKVWFDQDPNSQLAITTNKLLRRLNTSGTDLKDGFLEAEANDPQKGGEIWDFFVHYGVPIQTDVRGSKEYLWYFFSELEGWSTYNAADYYTYLTSLSGNRYLSAQPITELNISEAGINGYNVEYRWSYIETKSFAGQYASLAGKEISIDIIELEQTGTDPAYQTAVDAVIGPGTALGIWGNDPDKQGYHDLIVITRQNPDDPDNPGVPQGYQQMLIMGLSMRYKINTKDNDTNNYRFRYAEALLFGDDEETAEFRMPILYKSLKEVPTLHREEVCTDALTTTVFLVQRTKVRWYQTGFFKWVIIIIAIILIIYAIMNPGFLKEAMAFLQFATASTIAYVAAVVAFTFAIGWIISTAASNIGGRAGQLFAIIAAVAFFYSAGGFGNIADTFHQVVESPGWASAQAFISATYPIYNMGFTVYSTLVLEKLEADLRDFISSAKERQQELQDAWDAFGPVPSWLDPLDLVNIYIRQGQSELADSYFARVLEPNPGVQGYELISNFTDVALILPQAAGQSTVLDGMFNDFAKQRGAV